MGCKLRFESPVIPVSKSPRHSIQALSVQQEGSDPMLDRIRSKDKEKVQFYLEPAMIREIRLRSATQNKTQSKYIADLVDSDLATSRELLAPVMQEICGKLIALGYSLDDMLSLTREVYSKLPHPRTIYL